MGGRLHQRDGGGRGRWGDHGREHDLPASGELPLDGLEREAELAGQQAIADVFLHPVFGETTPEVLAQIPQLLESGCNTIKYFMSMPRFDAQAEGYLEATSWPVKTSCSP